MVFLGESLIAYCILKIGVLENCKLERRNNTDLNTSNIPNCLEWLGVPWWLDTGYIVIFIFSFIIPSHENIHIKSCPFKLLANAIFNHKICWQHEKDSFKQNKNYCNTIFKWQNTPWLLRQQRIILNTSRYCEVIIKGLLKPFTQP